MNTQETEPGIKIIETKKGLLIHGYLPGVEHLDADIADERVVLAGASPQGQFQQAIPLQAPINSDHTIMTYHDNQLRMVLPWRQEQ